MKKSKITEIEKMKNVKKIKIWYLDKTIETTIFKPDGTIVTYNQSKRRIK